MYTFAQIVEKLKKDQVIAYPTEAVFGLGCNPNSEQAVRTLLILKQRPEEKGLILIAPTLEFLRPYIDETKLSITEWQRLVQPSDRATTWIVPAKNNIPSYIRGKFNSVAVRLCQVPAVIELCNASGFALTSTSANLTGKPPCRTATEVIAQFGQTFPILNEKTGGKDNPSEIRDIFTQHILRKG
ncbi:tRNA threonylcarbamoyladenosine biosynthesis protein RimN [Vespertiliibacter pulmonis]|uniref:Threonylcarbamoyl-AMP synthase n=1 Tax=Vespertiliibacter pulmonis TaxID=1443036 RepID=A0A3N4VYZ8_9PAST|nr:Sua5/YciO/YrdC/YwlC family protein [Vespertiliibacter pulmonis]QLB20407.1 tRNA threonylcarbamoyladenosine biosynthesis protein RimN [Vespertiliibacter pulmonis]RPE86395.1 L-threonylcarbamoyladenylate synthase [Vespertiliibacter pulmonis]